MRLKFDVFNRQLKLVIRPGTSLFYLKKLPHMDTAGITSRCMDLQHVIFLDYDNIEKWLIVDELKLLQHYYLLTPFYLFTTKEEISKVSGNQFGNYHAICITKLPIHMVAEIQDKTHIDWKYKGMLRVSRYKSWVLRAAPKGDKPKPTYLGLVGDLVNLNNMVSEAHLNLLKTLYDIDYVPYANLDGQTDTYITTYKTGVGGNA